MEGILRLGLLRALWTLPWFTFGVGIVTLPFAGLLTWAMGRHAPDLRDAWGLLFGFGGLLALLGLMNLDRVELREIALDRGHG